MYTKAKKRLGQNFLIDKNIQNKIIAAFELKSSDYILEIGSGRGELTKLIAPNVSKVYALEIDSWLCEVSRINLKSYSNVEIINKDILKFDITKHLLGFRNRIKVVGNIPYYITSPIIEHLLKTPVILDMVFITVQKEFAKRMVSSSGSKEYGSFSCFVQYYTEPKILFYIKKSCFSPEPKIDSCLLRMNIKHKPILNQKQERLFFKIIRAAFNQRRKTLRNSLKDILPRKQLEIFYSKYNINPNIRPEQLDLKDFINLTNT